jgi:ubiquinone/menaquinone biosynthesis C-methylase UbiE
MEGFLNKLRRPSMRAEKKQVSEDAVRTNHYLNNLGLSLEQLKGKRILDIGAGSGAFVRSAIEAGADAVALDSEQFEGINENSTPFVLADAADMPFSNEDFDYVISHDAVPHMSMYDSPSEEQVIEEHERRSRQIKEMIRVVKSGGEMRFNIPRNENPDIFRRNASMELIIKDLKSNPDLDITEEFISSSSGRDPEGVLHTSDSYRITVHKKSVLAS